MTGKRPTGNCFDNGYSQTTRNSNTLIPFRSTAPGHPAAIHYPVYNPNHNLASFTGTVLIRRNIYTAIFKFNLIKSRDRVRIRVFADVY